MSAKIKNRAKNTGHHHRPKGINRHSFEKVYWPYIPLMIAVAGLLFLGLKGGALSHSLRHPSGEVLAYSTSMEPKNLLADTNAERQQNSEPILKINGELARAAQSKAQDMVNNDYWSHVTPSGVPPWQFFSAAGYQYQKAGENLAAGFDSEQAVVDAWMASPAHRHNLLDPGFTDVGFGVANIADYKAAGGGPMTVVVAFYGEPAGTVDTPLIASAGNNTGYTSQNPAAGNTILDHTTSRTQIALAKLHVYGLASVSALTIVAAALFIWGSRHVLLLRRVFIKGEQLVFHHPMVDVGLLLLTVLAFLLNQTAGFIQ